MFRVRGFLSHESAEGTGRFRANHSIVSASHHSHTRHFTSHILEEPLELFDHARQPTGDFHRSVRCLSLFCFVVGARGGKQQPRFSIWKKSLTGTGLRTSSANCFVRFVPCSGRTRSTETHEMDGCCHTPVFHELQLRIEFNDLQHFLHPCLLEQTSSCWKNYKPGRRASKEKCSAVSSPKSVDWTKFTGPHDMLHETDECCRAPVFHELQFRIEFKCRKGSDCSNIGKRWC